MELLWDLSFSSTYLYEQSFCISQDRLGYVVKANKPSKVNGLKQNSEVNFLAMQSLLWLHWLLPLEHAASSDAVAGKRSK